MSTLDDDPRNLLGQNHLDPALETAFRARGYVYVGVATGNGGTQVYVCSRRPMAAVAVDFLVEQRQAAAALVSGAQPVTA